MKSPQEIGRVLQNILGNAFEAVYAKAGQAGSGTGLGLSLSYDIVVKGYGGTLTVESEAGEGALFVIRLLDDA